MGNTFKSHTEEDMIMELITISNDTLTAETIYDAIMKSNCNL